MRRVVVLAVRPPVLTALQPDSHLPRSSSRLDPSACRPTKNSRSIVASSRR